MYISTNLAVDAVKRKAEDAVIASIAAKLPIVGEKGTILDYENSYKQARFENKDGVSNNSTGYYFGNRESKKTAQSNHLILASAGDEETVTASAAYAFKEPLKTGGLVNGYESSEEDN